MEAKQPRARLLAFYLPQFHPIPENDEWWGKGFTEWTNVGKAKPLFPGHYQPRVPADLGYYDLRVPETREAQAQMAKDAGVEGFVYWHYWFGNGKRLLERPFNEVLASGKPDFPFALAWANETWSGTFHGLKQGEVLIEQTYPGDGDDIAHFYAVLPAFKDKRYITCDGKPIFFVYKPMKHPKMAHFIELWQQLAKENGLKGIYFVAHHAHCYDLKQNLANKETFLSYGFDCMNVVNTFRGEITEFKYRLIRKVFVKTFKLIPDVRPYSYNQMRCPVDDDEMVMPTVFPNWDHSPRAGKKSIIICGSTPELFREFLHRKLELIKNKPFEHRFLMIKSWNEWAEGNYMEPDLKFGHAYLDALKSELYD